MGTDKNIKLHIVTDIKVNSFKHKMSYEEVDYSQTEAPVQEEKAAEKDLCRDFKKGDCRRGERCIYHHPKLDVCRDYQNGRCSRQDCRFVHATRQEEETYTNSGILPSHMNNGQTMQSNPMNGTQSGGGFGLNGILGKRNYNTMSGAPMAMSYGQQNSSSSDLCRDFEKGDCRRGSRCKFIHPKLVICRDFQKEKCERDNCRFLHMTREEEETYDGNGIVPDHIDQDKLKKNKMMAPGDGAAGMGGMYGKQQRLDNFQSGVPNATLQAVLQENEVLKSKLTEMHQQIINLRKMNDTLYEQNTNYRNQQNVYN